MSKPEFQTLLYKVENDILSITLNRPEKRNALNEQMVQDLNTIFLDHRDNDDIKGVSITGAGKSFCSGADLSYLQSLGSKSFEENLKDSDNLKEMYWNIFSFPKPTVGLINGPAVAGGCGLVTALDVAIASKNAIFGYPEVKIGFVASIVSVFLIQAVGLAHTKQLLYTGELIDADQAKIIGLVSNVVAEDELDTESDAFFSKIRNNSPQALRKTKDLLLKIQGKVVKQNIEQASRLNAESRQTDDFKEGLQSFLEKREPIWGKRVNS